MLSNVRNDRPFLLIPYEYKGAQHHYEPNYIVKLSNGKSVLLEMPNSMGITPSIRQRVVGCLP